MLLVFVAAQIVLTLGALRASKLLHRRLIETVLGTTMRWLDKTPASRIITRCTQDVSSGEFYRICFLLHVLKLCNDSRHDHSGHVLPSL